MKLDMHADGRMGRGVHIRLTCVAGMRLGRLCLWLCLLLLLLLLL
jgi:hypothetical protein